MTKYPDDILLEQIERLICKVKVDENEDEKKLFFHILRRTLRDEFTKLNYFLPDWDLTQVVAAMMSTLFNQYDIRKGR